MAKYILLMASKGGVGKSVICKQISRELHRLGNKVTAMDYDPQQHFARFANLNDYMFAEDGDYIVVDTQGAHTETNIQIMEAMKEEDAKIVVPLRPTDDEYTEALRMRDRLEKFGLLDKAVFVINGAYRVTHKDVKKFSDLLRSSVNVSKAVFTQRTAFAKDPDSKVVSEVSNFLHTEILTK
ncbi:ParA family protein [Vibrio parahaemolyticus]|nr:ParA family protein [Vibrio parahaemolyticus]